MKCDSSSASAQSTNDGSSVLKATGKVHYHLLSQEHKAHDRNLEEWIFKCANEITTKKVLTNNEINGAVISLKIGVSQYIGTIANHFKLMLDIQKNTLSARDRYRFGLKQT